MTQKLVLLESPENTDGVIKAAGFDSDTGEVIISVGVHCLAQVEVTLTEEQFNRIHELIETTRETTPKVEVISLKAGQTL